MLSLFLTLVLAQDIKVPPEVAVPENNFVIIAPETKGTVVEWVMLTPGLTQLAQTELANQKKFVAVGPKGSYKVLCYTAIDNKPSKPAYVTITIGGSIPVPDNNELKNIIESVYGADVNPKKAESVRKMLTGFGEVLDGSKDIKTVSQLNKAVKEKVGAKLSADEVTPLRQVISDHLKSQFGILPNNPVDEAKLESVLKNLLKILEGVL